MTRVFAKRMESAIVVLGMLGLTACATTPEVSTTTSEGIHLQNYKTYSLHTGAVYDADVVKTGYETGVGKALEADIHEELERRGLKSKDHHSDLVFTYTAAKRPVYMGERQWPHQEGAIDLIATDATGRIIWSSHLQAILEPGDKAYHHLKEAVSKAFKNYPSIRP